MNPHPILGQVVIGYSPMIDRERTVTATRVTVFPSRPDAPLDAASLLAALDEVWPASGGNVSLNVVSESLLHDLMLASPATNMLIEVPAFMAVDAAHSEAIVQLHQRGNTLLIKGRPLREMPRMVLPCFKHSIIDLEDERRIDAVAPPGVSRQITHIQSGVRTLVDLDASFKRGAVAVLGWPIDDVVAANGRGGAQPDLATIVELMRRIDREDDIDRLEDALKLDPTLAFKLLRYINSPAFGLRVEVGSFRHALMLLGYKRLKRWLALLLASASKDRDMKPVMFSALRRGLLMEELVRASGSGEEHLRNEAFICGVFSLLDRMMKQSFAELLQSIPVPESVRQTLVDGNGPCSPQLDLVRAIENESVYDIRECADRLLLDGGEINRAVLRALAAATQIH